MRTDRELASRIIERALRLGASDVEVYQSAGTSLSVACRDAALERAETARSYAYGIRVIRQQRQGYAYSNIAADADLVLDSALETALLFSPDEFLTMAQQEDSVPEAQFDAPALPVYLYDPAVDSVDEQHALQCAVEIEQSARGHDPRITKIRRSSASFSQAEVHIMNSCGVTAHERITSCGGGISLAAEEGGDAQMGGGFQSSRQRDLMNFCAIGTEAAQRTLQLLGAVRIPAMRGEVLLDRQVAIEFLGVFSSMLSARAVLKGKSLLADRMGQQVISPLLNVVDDATDPASPGVRLFDGEGVAVRRTPLVMQGQLMTFMHNSYTARRMGVRTTGNAARGAGSAPVVGPRSLVLQAADSDRTLSVDALVASMDRGIIVLDAMGIHTVNAISGEFSIGVTGILVEGGQRRGAVREAVISGNLLEFFSSVQAVGDDFRYFGGTGAPSLLVGPVDISG